MKSHSSPPSQSLLEVWGGECAGYSLPLLTLPKVYCTMILFLLYLVICIMWFVPFHFHNGFLSSLIETYGDPFSQYRICPALMELRLDSGTYVCLDDSSFLVLFSSASCIKHGVKAVLLCGISHLLTWKSRGDQKALHQSLPRRCAHHHQETLGIFTNRCDWNYERNLKIGYVYC